MNENSRILQVPLAASRAGWLRRCSSVFRRLWKIYLNTPMGCEITARWIQGGSFRT